jgi:hypothetical protein
MTLGVVALAGSGCRAIVLDGLSDAGAAQDQNHTALAMRYADVPSNSLPYSFLPNNGPPNDGPPTDPNSLVLFFVNPGQQCAHPGIGSNCSQGGMGVCAAGPSQQFVLLIPPELDKPGLINLDDSRIGYEVDVATPGWGGGGGGGRGDASGTLNIVSSDETSLSVVLSGTGPAMYTSGGSQPAPTDVATFDGTYTVCRCDSPPPGSLSAPPDSGSPPDANASTGSTALAMRLSDAPSGAMQPPGMSSLDPNSLVLYFANVGQQCAAPSVSSMCPSGSGPGGEPTYAAVPTQQLTLVIPPELDSQGVIDLQADQIPFAEVFANPDCSGGGGGGSAYSGTLNIVSSDQTTLSVVLSGTPDSFDGTYTVARCDAPPPPPTPIATIAIRGSNLPAGCAPGSTADPNTLFIFFGTASETCDNPWASIDSTVTSRGLIALPSSLQTSGVLQLSSSAIAASYPLPVTATLATCTAPSEAFTQGTVDIVSVGATDVQFRVSGVGNTATAPGFDGLYDATLCP